MKKKVHITLDWMSQYWRLSTWLFSWCFQLELYANIHICTSLFNLMMDCIEVAHTFLFILFEKGGFGRWLRGGVQYTPDLNLYDNLGAIMKNQIENVLLKTFPTSSRILNRIWQSFGEIKSWTTNVEKLFCLFKTRVGFMESSVGKWNKII